jgi:hypothetical protein
MVALVAAVFIALVVQGIAPQSPWRAMAFWLAALSCTAVVIKGYTVQCPNCNASIAYMAVGRRWGRKPTLGLDRCERCGLHLDDEIPEKQKP